MINFMDKQKEVSHDYERVINDILSKVPLDKQAVALELLKNPKALETYEILHEYNTPDNVIVETMSYGLQDLARDKHPSLGHYVVAMGEFLKRHGVYDVVIEEMHREGILTDKDYIRITGKVKDSLKFHSKKTSRTLDELLRKVAIIFFFSISGILLLGNVQVTGAVVGASNSYSSFNIFIGVLVLVFGLILVRKESN